ncbi:MAG: 16S rRNA (guanine(527)-N(7))-methyltransferase RsmG [Gemmatimonadetes bacterium]|nr:16S rRNA (guanine(527)-N(7))-methyltransferase RsmG [Gemmatimonadota bacterium]MYG84766.1 16S rRNA (guanine(527)-N(7))-methyltransferase RsmG [Gemmatimonadota bacterium]MYJ89235.1 16S rRNA (guanine(527)-N(7))-methyltransferase RsmG [Gemmatimonadota bacterium]
MDTIKHFVHGVEQLGHRLDTRKIGAFERYLYELRRVNHVLRIISTNNLERIPSRHFLDSLMPALKGVLPTGGVIVDIGSGGGFPGIPLAIFLPGTHFVLVESNYKKCAFLRMLRRALSLDNLNVCNVRIERLSEKSSETLYDGAVARAVGSIGQLVEWGWPILKPGGKLICYKGPGPDEEIDSAASVMEAQGMVWEATVPYEEGVVNSPTLVVLTKCEKEGP